jgi:hypothetical protein
MPRKLHFQSRILRRWGKNVYINVVTGRKVYRVRETDIFQKRILILNQRGQLLDPETGRFTRRYKGDIVRDSVTGKRITVSEYEFEKRLRTIERITFTKLHVIRDVRGRFVSYKKSYREFQRDVKEAGGLLGYAAMSVAESVEELGRRLAERYKEERERSVEAEVFEEPFEEPFEEEETETETEMEMEAETEMEMEAEEEEEEVGAEMEEEADIFDDEILEDELDELFDENAYESVMG